MKTLIPLIFSAILMPTFGEAVVIFVEEATVTKTREVGTAQTEEMRVYGTDGTHINAIITRTPVTVTYTVTSDVGLQPGDMDQLREDAVQCDSGRASNQSEAVVGDLVVFRFECLTR